MALFRKAGGGGGGFLHDVDITILGYEFETKEWKPKDKKKGKSYHTLTARLDFQQDGAEKPGKTFLKCGFWYPDSMTIVDGVTLKGKDKDGDEVDLERPIIDDDSEFGKFIASAIEKGMPESDFGENGSNFEAIVNQRFHTIKVVDRPTQIRIGRARLAEKDPVGAKRATDEECFAAGKEQDKNDKSKSYNVQYLAVDAVLGEAEKPAKGSGKAKASKSDEKPAAKADKKSKKSSDDDDLEDEAVDLLKVLLKTKGKDGVINRSQLSGKVVAYAVDVDMEDEKRDALRKLIASEDFLNNGRGWSYDSDGKQPVTLD